MRTILPIIGVLCLLLASMVMSLSGFAGVIGLDDSSKDLEGQEKLEQENSSAPQNEGDIDGSVGGSDNSMLGLVLDSAQAFIDGAGFVILLPLNLMKLGVPGFVAIPAGIGANIIVGWGLFQAVAGRVWR